MKLVMTLLARDEVDIIESNIRYHLDQGVDFIIATDNRSIDGTTEILRKFESERVLRLIDERGDTYSQWRWVTRMARSAAAVDGADWVINNDADEFWWPREGTLKSVVEQVPPGVGLIRAERLDFVPVSESGEPPHRAMTVRKAKSSAFDGGLLPPKVMHRAHRRVLVSQGNHAVRWPRFVPLAGDSPIEILHFPMRSFAQFENKIVNGGAAYDRNKLLRKRVGHAWRHLYDVHATGGLEDYYRRQELGHAAVEAGLADGSLVRDERLRAFMDRDVAGL